MTGHFHFCNRSLLLLLLITVAFGAFPSCRSRSDQPDTPSAAETHGNEPATNNERSDPASDAPPSPFRFELMTAEAGVDFVYYGAPTDRAFMTEQNGGGVALADFNNDGRLDVFFVNGSDFRLPGRGLEQSNQLYLAQGAFRYKNATRAAGLVAHGFGMGCTTDDYDNDGFSDLFVAAYGQLRLWRNNGDGTFSEVTQEAGFDSKLWGTSTAFADLDGDGLSDLYVVNYVDWSPEEPPCHRPGHPEMLTVCSPMNRSGQRDALYRNTGDGRFVEIGAEAGMADAANAKGLALSISDFDQDGRLDVYVANDQTPNDLYRNVGQMEFEEIAVVQGVAISSDGVPGASMGVALADYDGNGQLDMCITNFRNQVNDLFANYGEAGFVAVNAQMGIDLVSRPMLSFGIVAADFDLDTWPDLFVANGHIWDLTSFGPGYEFEMHPQLLWNRRGERFTDVSADCGGYFKQRWLGRSAAVGDLDNDGDDDLVVTHLAAPPALLRNDSKRSNESVRIQLVGTEASRQSRGARIEIVTEKSRHVTQVPAGGSFQASHDPRVIVAVPSLAAIRQIKVWWPGGEIETWLETRADRSGDLRLIQGTGTLSEQSNERSPSR
ncbi:MAG: CRTAC1 family protein [Planctomycetota bacterium]|nr:MAG: CRTAC1 family protein [Planctomycetota bacterium]REJ90847.1 MAG: CRTAC1 family protein [Planctomycetota bacterium]REK22123.1 MAG: CRTAC1 family protein [Planctomycetota bacterium]REK34935.1 MAG: CRTAC1 family protein [Planctomycetota bacterium]